jgi:hypothetical protein
MPREAENEEYDTHRDERGGARDGDERHEAIVARGRSRLGHGFVRDVCQWGSDRGV